MTNQRQSTYLDREPVQTNRATSVSAPWAISLRQVNIWLPLMPCCRATSDTLMPGKYVSSTIRTFSSGVQRLRR